MSSAFFPAFPHRTVRFLLFLGLALGAALLGHAQTPTPRFGGLVQTFAQTGGTGIDTGFGLRTTRLLADWQPSPWLQFDIQTDLQRDPILLDARLRLQHAHLTVSAGLYKVPFSFTELLPEGEVWFSSRARAVSALAPSRNVGVSLGMAVTPGWVAHLGAFNGNGGTTYTNDNAALLYVARTTWTWPAQAPQPLLRVGLSGAYSQDENVRLRHIGDGYQGTRWVGGTEVILDAPPLALRAEALAGHFIPDSVVVGSRRPFTTRGGFAEVRLALREDLALLAGLDRFDPGLPESGWTDVVRGGFAYQPHPAVRTLVEASTGLQNDAPTWHVVAQLQVWLR